MIEIARLGGSYLRLGRYRPMWAPPLPSIQFSPKGASLQILCTIWASILCTHVEFCVVTT